MIDNEHGVGDTERLLKALSLSDDWASEVGSSTTVRTEAFYQVAPRGGVGGGGSIV